MTAGARLSSHAHGKRLTGKPVSVGLAAGAALLVAALPVAMALANRSAPVLLLLASLAAAACIVTQAGWHSVGRGLVGLTRSPVAWGSVAFVTLSILSSAWSADHAASWRTIEEGAVPLLAGAVLLCLLPRVAPHWTGLAVALGVIVAGLISIGELRSGMPIRKALHLRAIAFEYNRPVLTMLALFWPLCALAFRARSPRAFESRDEGLAALPKFGATAMSLAFWLALAVTTIAIWASQSGTARFAQVSSIIAALFASRFPRAVLIALGIGVSVVFATVFAFGDFAWHLLPNSTYELLAWAHAADRVEIWRSFGAAALFHPFFGTGIGTSVTLGDTAVATQVASEFRRMLSVGHPHNGYLQIGVELGAVGCAIAIAIVLLMLRSWRGVSGPPLWSRVGLFTMIATAMLVGHGAWQAWWLAVSFLAGALIRTVEYPCDPRTIDAGANF
ncbi:MAG: O-antigen ligase family protein [Hyphomicrobiales bacterium]|nr:O-antigen ligase family protein [Hyphomicrobiales bacterium]